MNKWTLEQQKAIETRGHNLLVSAAAGSGKTAVLVERIIKMIMDEKDPVDVDRMLIMTFTNAAAAEMRERITDALSKAVSEEPNNKRLKKQFALIQRANINTIHSFCLSVIRSNFDKIDLEPDFKIGDDTENTLLKEEAVEELMEEMYEEGNEDFYDLVESYTTYKDDRKIADMVLNLYDFIMNMPYPRKWLHEAVLEFCPENFKALESTRWYKALLDITLIKLEGARALLLRALEIIKKDSTIEFYKDNIDKEIVCLQTFINKVKTKEEIKAEDLCLLNFGTLKRASGDYNKDAAENVKKSRDEAKKSLEEIKKDFNRLSIDNIKSEMEKLYPILCCLEDLTLKFMDRYKKKKRDKGILDFNDIEHYCLKILCSEEDGNVTITEAARIYREKFQEVFVDEYQDSNLVQEVIMNAVSRHDEKVPNLFMVGDIKQSIYRFRGGKPELFMKKYNSFSLSDNSLNMKINLHKNFRSKREILDASNYIFHNLMSSSVGEMDYTEEEELNFGADYYEEGENSKGQVEVDVINRKEDENEALEDDEESLDNIKLEARFVAKKIGEILGPSSSLKVYDKNKKSYRKPSYRDIVILLRTTKNWADGFVEELKAFGIPVYADSSSGYFDTLEVKIMTSLLEIIDNPNQDIPLMAVLRSPVFGFTSNELSEIMARGKEKTAPEYGFYSFLCKTSEGDDELSKKCQLFLSKLLEYRKQSLYMPIHQLLWHLYMDTGYYGYVGAMENGVLRQANLRILFERAEKFENSSMKGLFNFISFINRVKLSSKDMGSAKILSENEDVVRIMSIHKSKGLEFPIVFLSGTGKNFNKMDLRESILLHGELGLGPLYVDTNRRLSYDTIMKSAISYKINIENISEEMRILYVAMTRAKENLIITGSLRDAKASLNSYFKEASTGRLSDSFKLKAKSYMDFICASLIKHKDGEPLRKFADIDDFKGEDAIGSFKVSVIERGEIESFKIQSAEGEEVSNTHHIDEDVLKEVYRRLNFKYDFKNIDTPAKITVSELKNMLLDDEGTKPFIEEEFTTLPEFLKEGTKLTSSDRGTAYHEVMRGINIKKHMDTSYVNHEIKRMVSAGILTKEQGDVVYAAKVRDFFEGSLGKRLIESSYLEREMNFQIKMNPKEIYGVEHDASDTYIVLQGTVDCFFKEGDGLILLDYKTDFIEGDNREKLIEKYSLQLKYYAIALEKIMNMPVKEKYLYFFQNGEALKI